MTESLLQKVRRADKLPALPIVTLEALRMLQVENVPIEQLVDLIKRDPGLTATILKVVNSPFYGLLHRVVSLKDAINMIGINIMKLLVVSISLVGNLKDSRTRLPHSLYWQRSLFSAITALLLAKKASPKLAEDAFVTGLLADIGMLAASLYAADEYFQVFALWSAKQRPLLEIEKEQMGFSHASLGRELLRNWRLPEHVCVAIGAHQGEELEALSPKASELAHIVRAASAVAELFCQDTSATELPRVKEICRTVKGIDDTFLESLLNAIGSHVKDLAMLLAVPVGQVVTYEIIKERARIV